jgi:hypothetical protein
MNIRPLITTVISLASEYAPRVLRSVGRTRKNKWSPATQNQPTPNNDRPASRQQVRAYLRAQEYADARRYDVPRRNRRMIARAKAARRFAEMSAAKAKAATA